MRNVSSFWIPFAFSMTGSLLFAAKNGEAPVQPDQINVIAHIPLGGAPVTHLATGAHWRRNYLYLDRGDGTSLTVFDVTHPSTPKESGKLDLPKQEAKGDVSTVVGNALLVASGQPSAAPRTITIVSLADAEHPKIMRKFPGVTAMLKDDARRLIYLTNPEGLWVLHLDPATDLELEKEYEHYVRYNP